jgi:SAM-dependent methyltransferase
MTVDIGAPGTGTTLPGSLGAAVAALGERASIRDLYDRHGARVYDDSTHLFPEEIRALRRVLRTQRGAVLELAAGSGRLTVPLLTMGRQTTAIELSGGMIEVLHENVGQLPEAARRLLTVHQGDMTSFELDTTFAVVVLGAASISLLDETGRARLFRTVRRHLAPGGVMLFSIAVDMDGPPSADVDRAEEVTGRSGQRYRVHEFRPAGSARRWVGVYPVSGDGTAGAEPGAVVPVCVSTHRVLALEPMLREVEAAGLVVRDQHVYEGGGQIAEVFLEVGEPT